MLQLTRQLSYRLGLSHELLQFLLLSGLGYMLVAGEEVEFLCQRDLGSFLPVVLEALVVLGRHSMSF